MGQSPWPEVVLFEVLHITILYPTRHHAYRVFLFAGYQKPGFAEPVRTPYSIGVSVALYLGSTVYLLWGEGSFPGHWRRVCDEAHVKRSPGGLDNLPSNFPFTKKFWWVLDLASSPRMVGWVREPRDHLPKHPPPSRRTFLWKTVLEFIVNSFLIPDLLSLVLGQTLVFDSRLHDPTSGPETYLAGFLSYVACPMSCLLFFQLRSR